MDDYYKVVGKLKQADIPYRTATNVDLRSNAMQLSRRNDEYLIYVKRSDQKKAVTAIHH